MKFPSPEFEDAVAALCHGTATQTQQRELTALLTEDAAARDEYLWRVELHARLASEPSLYVGVEVSSKIVELPRKSRTLKYAAIASLAACLVALAAFLGLRESENREPKLIAEATQPISTAPVPSVPEPTEADVMALNLRLQSLRARLAVTEDRMQLLEMARSAAKSSIEAAP